VRKQALHARLAVAVEETDQIASRIERLALLLHHRVQAGEREPAAAAAEQLGLEAMRSHAFQQAASAFDTSLTLWRSAPAGTSPWEDARLLLLRGDALLAASDPEAVAVLAEAERCANAARDPALAGRAQLRRGRAHARREEHELAVQALRAALDSFAIAGGHDREAFLADVELIALLGTSLAAYQEAVEIGERALAGVMARPDDPALEAAVRLELAKALMRSGDLDTGQAQLVPALGLALGAGSLDLAAEISGALANHAYWTGQLDLSERAARHRRDYATQAGDPFALRHARSWLANIAIARGDWTVARGLIADATEDVERVDSPEPAAFLNHLSGMIALALGQQDDAISCFEAAMSGFRQLGTASLPWYLGLLAHAYQAAGNQAAAEEAVRETERVIAGFPAGALPVAPALAQLGIAAVLRGDATAAGRIYSALRAYSGQFHWVLIDRVLGMLADTIGDREAARRYLAGASAAALRGGLRPEHALSMAEQAVASARAGLGDRALAERDQAIARLRALGMEGAVRRVEQLAGAALADPPAGNPAGLTDREVTVLRLLARGLTNREIGELLHISEKTVINHLTHIYTKAGVENRAGAVMFAVRYGLASS
jgi:DNA-binding CsgD family transcriptional regulator/tetratricopeptide (TPR) repeat protein